MWISDPFCRDLPPTPPTYIMNKKIIHTRFVTCEVHIVSLVTTTPQKFRQTSYYFKISFQESS